MPNIPLQSLERANFTEGSDDSSSTRNVFWDFNDSFRYPNGAPAVTLPAATEMTNRLRVATANRIFEATWQYNKNAIFWTEQNSGSGAITNPTQKDPAYLNFTTTSASGDIARIGTKRFLKYQAFRTHILSFAAVFFEAKENCSKKIGQFTNFNGWFFEQDGNGMHVVVRNNTDEVSGTIETKVARADWNVDKFDGTGPSELNLNLDNILTFIIEYVWHGTQGIKFGIQYFDKLYWCHFYIWSATDTIPFSRSALLPIRAEIENTGTVTGGSEMDLGPVSMNIEGGEDERGFTFSEGHGTNGITVALTRTLMFALRPKATINGSNNRGFMIPTNIELYTGDVIYYEIFANSSTTGGTWLSADPDSIAEYNLNPTTLSVLGRRVKSGHVAGTSTSVTTLSRDFERDIFVSLDAFNSNTPLELVVAATRIGGNTTAYCNVDWREIY